MTHDDKQQLDRIEAAVNDVRVMIATQQERTASIARDVAELKLTVYGEDPPGLKTRVERIETAWKAIWAALAIIAGLVGTIVGWLV